MAEKYPNTSPFVFAANSPLYYLDPDGKVIIPVHGTWSGPATWQDLNGITKASYNLFQDDNLGKNYRWSGSNYASSRTMAAIGFDGMEKVNEIYGRGTHYDFGARYYDARVGRFFSVDFLSRSCINRVGKCICKYNILKINFRIF